MNKSVLRRFGWDARNLLIEDVSNRALGLGITKTAFPKAVYYQGGIKLDNGRELDDITMLQWDSLRNRWRDRGFDSLIEDTAYTWFNRFIALRYMEVNGYLPHSAHVVAGRVGDETGEPEIITLALQAGIGVDVNRYIRLREANKTTELYRHVLTCQCNALHKLLPKMFEQDGDSTEILLPVEGILKMGGFRRRLLEDIEEADWLEGVEIIGWLYQFYIAEKKDKYFASKDKVTKDTLPAATQLFTPEWIVRYLVENSLGRLWAENKGGIVADSQPAEIKELKANWKYYIDTPEQTQEVLQTLEAARNKGIRPSDITVLDPAMGSGHMLVYAFDVLYQIYLSQGYAAEDIPTLILRNNLFGLDIDDRAAQLAYFAVMMRALSYDRRILQRGVLPHVMDIVESPTLDMEWLDYLADRKPINRAMWQNLLDTFKDADLLGSLIRPEGIDFDTLGARIDELREEPVPITLERREGIWETLTALVEQGRVLAGKYDVVVTNPPYMGLKKMVSKLSDYLQEKHPISKFELSSVFLEVCLRFSKLHGFSSLITQHGWMYQSSYESFRDQLLKKSVVNMVHLGARAFEDIGGEVVQSTVFVMSNLNAKNRVATYVRLTDYNSQEKEKAFLNFMNRYTVSQSRFMEVSGKVFAYWISNNIISLYKQKKVSDFSFTFQGIITGQTDVFLRLWHEIPVRNISFGFEKYQELESTNTFFPYIKGGSFRRWHGNHDYIIRWRNNGNEFVRSRTENRSYFFKAGIAWSDLSTGLFGARNVTGGFLFDASGPMLFVNDIMLRNYIIAYLNSNVFQKLLDINGAGLHYGNGVVAQQPFIYDKTSAKNIGDTTANCILLSRNDWDSFEYSWDFITHPLHTHLQNDSQLSAAYESWAQTALDRFQTLKCNEEELNRIFIDIYGLQDELTPDVPDDEITVRKADRPREAKSFLSWFIGCTLGRYSTDKPGLQYAGGDFPTEGFPYCLYNVLPITEEDSFGDEDIITHLRAFLESLCGSAQSAKERKQTVEANLAWLAQSIDAKSTNSEETLRKYFLKDFMKDHLRIYKNRPIYWLFDSGKTNGFKALIYLHRYRKDTVARLRTDYLLRVQTGYEAALSRINMKPDTELTGAERKQRDILTKKVAECRSYDAAVAHMASRMIELDLDDGVRVNYMKFQNIDDGRGAKINLLYPVDMKVED